METLLTFAAVMLLTYFFVRRYVKTLAVAHGPAAASAALAPVKAQDAGSCPRCGKSLFETSSFCPACGAPMALWKVHRAAVKIPANGAPTGNKGQPRPVINATLCMGCGTCRDSCPEAGTLAVVGGKSMLAHPERCTGHAKCVEVCPMSAITLAFGNALQTLQAPLVKENFETNIPGIFIAGELSGMGLIKTAINEGKLAIDSIMRRLEEHGEWTPPVSADGHGPAIVPSAPGDDDRPYDVIVVGAGPAGLSASLTALQHGLRYLTLEQGEVASTIRNYPRHKFLMSEPVEMPLYGSLYVSDGTKESLLSVWETIVANTGVQVRTQERVESVIREGPLLKVGTSKGSYPARSIVLALGKRGSPRRLGIPGEGLAKVTYRLIEAESFEDKDILVVGGGDSAIEASLALSKASRNRVTLSHRKDTFERARERNRKMLEEAEQQSRIRILRRSQPTGITPQAVLLEADGKSLELQNDFVFVLIGGESPEGFLRKIGIEIVEKIIGTPAVHEPEAVAV